MLEEVKRMKEAVINSKLSYLELEKLTGVSHSTLHRYLTGKTNRIPLSAVEKIASATGVSAAWIMGWEDTPTPETTVTAEDLAEINEMIEIISQLSDEERKIVDGFIQGLIAKREKDKSNENK